MLERLLRVVSKCAMLSMAPRSLRVAERLTWFGQDEEDWQADGWPPDYNSREKSLDSSLAKAAKPPAPSLPFA
jgi:hypothetical protein